MRPTLALLLAVAFTVGCDAWLTKPGMYNTVTVVVSRRNGQPVPDVPLTLYTGQRPMGYAMTGRDGRHVFQEVPQGNYGVFTSPPDGYDVIEHLIPGPPTIYRDDLIVAKDTLSPLRFTFLKRGPGSVIVRVTDPVFGSLAGVAVTLSTSQTTEGKATTDSAGRASFTAIPYGVHSVSIQRPLLYRDYATPGDSLVSSRSNIVVDDGSNDTTTFVVKRCAGTMRAVLVDDVAGLPVANATVSFYTSTQQLGSGTSGAAGTVVFSAAPCVIQLGMSVTPGAGYTIPAGRGSQFVDGLTLTNGGTVEATFRLHRLP
jgi:hypothetical protein